MEQDYPVLGLQKTANRKHQFKLDAAVLQEGNFWVFIKKAKNAEAVAFLQVIIEREKKAKEFFKDNAEVITGTLTGDCIRYPFLDFPSLEKLIEESLVKKETHRGAEYISHYIGFLQRLSAIECYPEGFITKFSIPISQITGPIRCFTSGPIDCIPSNILVDKDSWYVLDHEWFFDFPIPLDLIIYRGIMSLMERLQHHIQTATCRQCPSVLYNGYGKKRTYIPLAWLQLFRETTTISLQHLADWNWLFQNQILLYENKRTNLRFREGSKLYEKIKPPFIEIILSESYRYLKKRYRIQKL